MGGREQKLRELFLSPPATPKELFLLQRELAAGAEVRRGRLLPAKR